MNTSSLQGLCVLNTRPKDQAHLLSQQIRAAGGVSIECPLIEIKATRTDWLRALPDLNTLDQAIFVSANAVQHYFATLQLNKLHWPEHTRVIAIGQGTALALQGFKVSPTEIPEVADSEHLLTLNSLKTPENQTILLIKGKGGRTLIEEQLSLRKARLISLTVYERVLPEIPQNFIHSLWRDDRVDIILLTSEQSIRNLFKVFGKEAHCWLQNKACLLISERLAELARLFGIKNIILGPPHRVMDTLLEYQGLLNDQ